MAIPENLNLALNTNFNMVFSQSPELVFFAQEITFPGVSLGEISTPWHNNSGYMPDNKIEYDPLTVDFLLDEEMQTYRYLVDWVRRVADRGALKDQFQDATILFNNNNAQENRRLVLIGMFPTAVTSFQLTSNTVDPIQVNFSATFRYQMFYFENLRE